MIETYITLKTALLIKEKGFDIPCKKAYIETIEYTLSCRGEDITFPKIPARILDFSSRDHSDKVIAWAPAQSALQKWFRETHKIHLSPDLPWTENGWILKGYCLRTGTTLFEINIYKKFNSYEEVLERGFERAIDELKSRKNAK